MKTLNRRDFNKFALATIAYLGKETKLHPRLFPILKNGKWGRIDLNLESRNLDIDFTNPAVCERWINELHSKRGLDYSFGGFLEDRSNIWKNHYLKRTRAFVHLGVDYNIPANTSVALVRPGRVIDVFKDKDQSGGWGGRVLFRLDNGIYLIYGHLKHDLSVKVGEEYPSGFIVGKTGERSENGGWYPHLHVQLMDEEFIKSFNGRFRDIDGYLRKDDKRLSDVSNPERFFNF